MNIDISTFRPEHVDFGPVSFFIGACVKSFGVSEVKCNTNYCVLQIAVSVSHTHCMIKGKNYVIFNVAYVRVCIFLSI